MYILINLINNYLLTYLLTYLLCSAVALGCKRCQLQVFEQTRCGRVPALPANTAVQPGMKQSLVSVADSGPQLNKRWLNAKNMLYNDYPENDYVIISFDRRLLLMSMLFISANKQCSYSNITLSLITERPTTMSYLKCGSYYFHISL